jgi:hypothetical protein
MLIIITLGCSNGDSKPVKPEGSDDGKEKPTEISKDGHLQFDKETGKYTLIPVFSEAGNFSNGLAPVKFDFLGDMWGYIDKQGKITLAPDFINASEFSEELALVSTYETSQISELPSRYGQDFDIDLIKYEFINKQGIPLFDNSSVFSIGRTFSDGLAAVKLINNDSQPKYSSIFYKNGNITGRPDFLNQVSPDFCSSYLDYEYISASDWGFINKKGKVAFASEFKECGEFSEGLAAIKDENSKWGYIDKKGNIKIQPQFQAAMKFSNGLAPVQNEELKYGYIDVHGNYKIQPSFEAALTFYDNLAPVEYNQLWGYVDKDGNTVIDYKYSEANGFSEGLAAVKINDKWGYINEKGVIIVSPQYATAGAFKDGLALVKDFANELMYINTDGKVAINLKTGLTWAFPEGLYPICIISDEYNDQIVGGSYNLDVLGKRTVKFGYIDGTMQFKIPPKFQSAYLFSEGLAAVRLGNMWGYINNTGNVVIDPQYFQCLDFSDGLAAVYALIDLSNDIRKWGYIDKNNKMILQPSYDYATSFSKGYAIVGIGDEATGKYYMIDKKEDKIMEITPENELYSEILSDREIRKYENAISP